MRNVRHLVLAAMFLALGLVLPFLTGQIPYIGNMLLPMHIPILLCGFLCGWQYGLIVGFITPVLRSFLFAMPPMYPHAVSMAFELATYGFLSGFLYQHSRWKCIFSLIRSLLAAMIGGRIVWGAVQVILSGVSGEVFTWQLFLSSAFLTALPGIILQLVLIPAIMLALDKTGLVPFSQETTGYRPLSYKGR